MSFVPTMSQDQLAETSKSAIENGLILYPDLPADMLADRLIDEAEKVFIKEYGRSLIVAAFIRAIRAHRKKPHKRPEGFERLPLWVPTYDGRVRLDKITAPRLRDFCKIRRAQFNSRKSDDPVLIEAEKLAERLQAAAKKRHKRGLTAGEVLGFEW